ncbi:MAG: tannase/feruloyl esterase family alpha/beta hydrolase [Caldimonas sp.]
MAACGGGGTVYVIEPDSCAKLFVETFDDATVTTAQIQPAADGYPKHCKLRGTTLAGRVGFELHVPLAGAWNGRLLMQGTGGYSGQIDPAIGGYRSLTGPGLMAEGYAVATTDTGHTGLQRFDTYFLQFLDGSWAKNDPVAEEDFAWRGMKAATSAAQLLLHRLRGPERFRTYYVGCSGGGRIGMKMAEKAPELFDGFAIGDPPLALSRDMIRTHWNLSTVSALPLSMTKLRLLGKTALERCDALDGAADGVVSDPESCHVNPFELVCTQGDGPDCLTQNEAVAAYRIYNGPTDSQGRQVVPGLPASGAEDCDGLCDDQESLGPRFREGWPWWFAGGPLSDLDAYDQPPIALQIERTFGNVVMTEFYRYLAFDPDTDNLRWQDLDPVSNPALLDRARALYDVNRFDFSDFRASGKRILMYSGWGDVLVGPSSITDFRQKVVQASGGEPATSEVFRLFMVPGMQHCEGGRSLDNFDVVGALVKWVETDAAPATLRASSRFTNVFPGRERDLCPYPQVSTYRGSGSFDDPASFECRPRPPLQR